MRTQATLLLMLLAACGGGRKNPSAATPVSSAARDSTSTGGIPKGYLARPDDSSRDIREVRYIMDDGRFDITTGPAHILYAARDTMRGTFTVASTFEQLAPPARPDGFGLFIGGADLDTPTQRYTFFVVRGTGEYTIRIREGSETRDVQGWSASPLIPRQNSEGRAKYRLAIKTDADSVRFFANGVVVRTLSRQSVPHLDGIAGIRVHQNLHVAADPLRRSGN